jgi:hypothetical protein
MQWTKVSDQRKSSQKSDNSLVSTRTAWVRTILASTQYESEAELLSFFIKSGLPIAEAKQWISCREQPIIQDY